MISNDLLTMDLNILDSDQSFKDSPEAGEKCLCSRCLKPILSEPVFRAWPEDIETNPDNNIEWRFHWDCIGIDIKSSNEIVEDCDEDCDEEFEDKKLFESCPNCHREYDEIDYEYQICHRCKFDANKKIK